MKIQKILPAVLLMASISHIADAGATVLFHDSFQNDLSQWQPDGGIFSGIITKAPDGQNAMTLTSYSAGHDMRTVKEFTSSSGTFTLEYDFMTTSRHTSGSGASIYANNSLHTDSWILADSPYGNTVVFPDSPTWEHVSYTFAVNGTTTWLMIEDWAGAPFRKVNSLFFRNMSLTDNPNGIAVDTLTVTPVQTAPKSVPEPATLALVALGLCGGAVARRKKAS
jgi:hypothetical protein